VVKDLQIDDVVLIVQPNLPRGQWPLERILNTFPGKDGHNRVSSTNWGQKSDATNTQVGSLKLLNVCQLIYIFIFALELDVPSAGRGNVKESGQFTIYCLHLTFIIKIISVLDEQKYWDENVFEGSKTYRKRF
jgi:hypothetical protein